MVKDFPYSKQEIADKLFEAGVVGAGGAGFPTHIKARARADVVIANGCECEPLLQTDKYVLAAAPDEVLDGLLLMMLATGATQGYVAVREGYGDIIESLRKRAEGLRGVEVVVVADNYPAGDEHVLVYEVTGRVIPQGGIPPDVGVVVSNVNTLVNVRRALEGVAVTNRVISVCGDVARPGVFEVPVGTSVQDVLELSGNDAGLERKGILLSGVMMGQYCEDLATPIDKRVGSVVVLPADNQVIVRKSLPVETIVRRAASVCCQCTLCTELCPRHLMGHALEPHRIMRAICWVRPFEPDLSGALLCSGCGLCGVYVCPMLLSPDRISFMVRSQMAQRGLTIEPQKTGQVMPLRAGRLIPHHRVVERTGLAAYERQLDFLGVLAPEKVSIPLLQHSGAAARAVVKAGDRVRKGQLIGDIEGDKLGARVHASIDGVVVGVNHQVSIERK